MLLRTRLFSGVFNSGSRTRTLHKSIEPGKPLDERRSCGYVFVYPLLTSNLKILIIVVNILVCELVERMCPPYIDLFTTGVITRTMNLRLITVTTMDTVTHRRVSPLSYTTDQMVE